MGGGHPGYPSRDAALVKDFWIWTVLAVGHLAVFFSLGLRQEEEEEQ